MKKHFKVKEENADKVTGTYHFRLVEEYKGIPIFGSESTLALDKNDNVTSFSVRSCQILMIKISIQ